MKKVNSGLLILAEMEASLPPSERKIAQYILKYPAKAIKMTAVDIGKQSHTSSAAVIRLCKSLNLSGIQELKLRIAGDLQREKIDIRDIEPNEPLELTIDKITKHSMQILHETADLIDQKELMHAVEAMLNAKRIFFFGVGASAIAAMDAYQKFLRINKYCMFLTDLHLGVTAVVNADEGDVVVGISFSGETHEVAKVLEIANNVNATTISLTRYGNSLVSSLANICLYTSPKVEATLRSGATSSRLAQLHVLDILFMCVATSTYNDTIEYLDHTRTAINNLHEKVGKRKDSYL
ncbi:MurR/RpiR family transcriptional regulator [Viridibacillus sp. NPDC096237]|uniref:MurR/RpiR family transcriptional regulator n=1 Tax=Viridibacillus sp. NPDC096237 TaxID=3390721 RepID=UPI003D01F6B2